MWDSLSFECKEESEEHTMSGQDASEIESNDKKHMGDLALEADVIGAKNVAAAARKSSVEIP